MTFIFDKQESEPIMSKMDQYKPKFDSIKKTCANFH